MKVILNNKEYYQLDITPQTSPRPRLGLFGVHMPVKYKHYCDCMIHEILKENIPNDDYSKLELIAYFPYPKSTAKKRLIEGFPMRVKPDYDNTAKTITDCLEKIEVLKNDSQIYKAIITKLYTIEKTGRILFRLLC